MINNEELIVACYLDLGDSPDSVREYVDALEAANTELKERAEKAEQELKKIQNYSTVGVGDGNGKLFVHGDCDSIKMVQSKLLELQKLRNAIKHIVDMNKLNTGAEPSLSCLYRAIDEAKELL